MVLVILFLVIGLSIGTSDNRVVPASEVEAKIKAVGPIEFDNCTIEGDLDLSAMKINEEVHFNNTLFRNSVNCSFTVFGKAAYFYSSDFNEYANFSFSSFKGDTEFVFSKFHGVDFCFSNFAKFEPLDGWRSPDFQSSIFNGDVGFGFSTYNGYANFGDSTYNGYANFSHSTYNGDADFRDSTYNGDADFRDSNYNGNAGFRGSTYNGNAGFGFSTYNGIVNFGDSTYNGNAGFRGSTYNGTTGFGFSTYNGTAGFGDSTYDGYANFGDSTYNGYANFSHSTYNGTTGFGFSTYNGDANFGDSTYNGTAGFGFSTYNGYADFGDSNYNSYAYFDAIKFYKDVTFDNSQFNDTDFVSSQFKGDALFENTTIQGKLSLTRTRYDKLYIRWYDITGGLVYDDAAYMTLMKNFKDLGYLEDYDGCYVQYRKEHRAQPWPGVSDWKEFIRKMIDYPLEWFYGYGKEPFNAFFISLGIVIVFAFYWRYVGLGGPKDKTKDSLKDGEEWLDGDVTDILGFSVTVFLSGTKFFIDPPALPKIEGRSRSWIKKAFILERVLGALFSVLFFVAIGGTIVRTA
jgi:hypothetical protein